MTQLQGRVAFITGAAKGIGFACAQALGRAGASLVLADVDDEALSNARASLQSEIEVPIETISCDVGDKTQVDAAIQAVIQRFGVLDIAVANAGIVKSAPFLETTEDDWDAIIRVNLKGVFLTGQAAARAMIDKKRPGSIINMSSVNSKLAIPKIAAYNASKGGINNLTRNMALNLAEHGIRVNAVAPGSVNTELFLSVAKNRDHMRDILSRTPMLRAAEPIEIGNVVKFLASDDASYITGQVLYVDGGRMALNYTLPVPEEALDAACARGF